MGKLINVVIVVVIILGGIALIGASYYYGPVIKANQLGVVLPGDSFWQDDFIILKPGKHYWFISGYNPFTTTLKLVDVSEKELNLGDKDGLDLTTKNGDHIKVAFSAWYRIVPDEVGKCVTSLEGKDIDTLVRKMVKTSARHQAALYDGETLLDGEIQKKFTDTVKNQVNLQLADRGLELTIFKCGEFHFSADLLQKIEAIKNAQAEIDVNKVKVKAAEIAAREMEELAKGRKQAAIQEAEARKKSTILASEAQITAAQNWLKAEEIKAQIFLIRSKIKAQAMQVEAQARELFAGPEGERYLRYQIAESLAEAWTRQGGNGTGVSAISTSLKDLSVPALADGTPKKKAVAPVKPAAAKK
jgi:regulator of protease activity HflC (stomatin/prohibitin superfamily)